MLNLHFDETRWETVRQAWATWWAGELDRPLIILQCVEHQYENTPHYAITYLGNWPLDFPADDLRDLDNLW